MMSRMTPGAKSLTMTLVFAACTVLAASAPSAAAEGKTKIKLGTLVPKGSSYYQILQTMGEKWRKASGGAVSLTIYADQSMGGEADLVRRMRVGQLDAGFMSAVGLWGIEPSSRSLQYIPMLFRSLDELDFVAERMRPMFEKRMLEKGFVVLFWSDAGWVHFFSKTPVLGPSELKKTKLWVWSGDNEQIDILKAAGFQPVPLETADVLPGLQTGLVNAVAFIPFGALTSQIYVSAPHMLQLNWVPLVGAAVISKRGWEKLPAATREAFRQAAREAGTEMKAKSRAEGERSIETMKKHGLIVHPVTPELEAEWRRFAEDSYPRIRGATVPADLFDELQRLLRDYRRTR